MMKSLAIPQRLLKAKLTKAEQEELLKFGDQPLTPEEYKFKRRIQLGKLDGEGLDAIRKEIAAIRAGEKENPDYAAYREKVQEIKDKNPKD